MLLVVLVLSWLFAVRGTWNNMLCYVILPPRQWHHPSASLRWYDCIRCCCDTHDRFLHIPRNLATPRWPHPNLPPSSHQPHRSYQKCDVGRDETPHHSNTLETQSYTPLQSLIGCFETPRPATGTANKAHQSPYFPSRTAAHQGTLSLQSRITEISTRSTKS